MLCSVTSRGGGAGIQVNQKDIMSTWGYLEYSRDVEYKGAIPRFIWRNIMSTLWSVQYVGGISWVHRWIS